MASLATSTIQQYTRPLRSWWTYCTSQDCSLFLPTVENVLDFLALELKSIKSYSTLNTTRSAISLISHNSIGENLLVRRFCKGVSTLKPPQLRYDHIWDPAPVIARLKILFPYDNLSLEKITKKLIVLLALGSGQRCQTLASIKISQISRNDGHLLIKVPDKVKTSAPGRRQPLLSFPRFSACESLCIATLIETYLDKTKNLRTEKCDSLFISFRKPFNAVGVQTVSRWIRVTLKECGIDEHFTAHSTRHAATSCAASKGVPVDAIKRAANWTGESQVFANFYNRPIINADAFSAAVLS